MKRGYFETFIGIFVIAIAVFFCVFVAKITGKKINTSTYDLYAKFENIEGLSIGSKVKIGGLDIGQISSLIIDEDYISDLKAYAEKILGVSNDIIVHDLILKEGENIPIWTESEVKNG